jgi:hypothetical protein
VDGELLELELYGQIAADVVSRLSNNVISGA